MTRRLAPLAVCICALLTVTGCGSKKERTTPLTTKTLRIALAPLNAGEAALYAADNEKAGLNVVFAITADPGTAITKVTQGRADLAVSTEPALLEARGKGARVISVAALTQRPFTSLIGPKLSVTSLLALATKPIGTEGLDYQQAMADTIFTKANVVNTGPDLAKALSSKKVAAVIAPFGGPALPPGVTALPVDEPLLKVPTFSEYVLVANEDAVRENGDVIRSYIGSLARGTHNIAAAQKQSAIAPFVKGGEAARVRALMLPPAGKPYGWQDAAKWSRFAAWMRQHRLPQKGSAGAFTNELLPGQGP
ncbi:MAG: putative hydroxymethylpyrimidine transport system substrate-binding protein [Thermoleophilaceae bacterium]|jgi:putative hydroxymethylpyrimidine transport system substrate-binding protein|nr:putative hydroxymethylpyrimidine transport system substrate-binding protein [Thermoleophilaceae bacterium]